MKLEYKVYEHQIETRGPPDSVDAGRLAASSRTAIGARKSACRVARGCLFNGAKNKVHVVGGGVDEWWTKAPERRRNGTRVSFVMVAIQCDAPKVNA